MYNFEPYNVLLSIAINIPVLLMTVLQGHIYFVQSIIMIITMSSIVILIVNLSHLYADVVLLAVWKTQFLFKLWMHYTQESVQIALP